MPIKTATVTYILDETADEYPRMVAYGFEEDKDFSTKMSESTGGRPSTDHIVALDMAKEISMIQRTAKGKQARQYFIECEKQARAPKIDGKCRRQTCIG